MKGRVLLIIAFMLILFSCKNQKTEQRTKIPAAEDSVVGLQKQNAPPWALSLPQRDGYLYAVGQASSSRPEIARKKAMLDAQTKLAEKLSQRGDSLNVLLRWSRVKAEKQLKEGRRWKNFVLMEVSLTRQEN